MPIINGQKMACEPCIRGHRSTKCSHASERLMVPVRKPGRPLSICPHPPARQCGCAGVTAAIPRRQTCHCGRNGETKEPNPPVVETTPSSPTKATSGPFRIQKASKSSSRKQSIDPSNLERVDATHVNILPPFDGRQSEQTSNGVATTTLPTSVGSEFTSMPVPIMPNHPGGLAQMMYPMYPRHMVAPTSNCSDGSAHPNGLNGAHGEASVPVSASASHVASSAMSAALVGQHRRSNSKSNGNVESKPGSCCQQSASPNSTDTKPPPGLIPTMPISESTGAAMSNMPPNQSPYQPFFPQPTVFTYPPHYGSYLYPLLPEMWRQAMASMGAGGINPAMVDQPNLNFVPDSTPQTPTLGVSHMCTCGDECQCVGCAAHPYNDATQNYVKSAWNSMMEDGWSNGVNGINSAISTMAPIGELPSTTANAVDDLPRTIVTRSPTMASPPINGTGPSPCCVNSATPAPGQGKSSPRSPTAPQTPSDSASLASDEQQNLSASDFFFVTYPFNDACVGETASCPCGDDCQCLGCVVHGNAPVQSNSDASPTVPPP